MDTRTMIEELINQHESFQKTIVGLNQQEYEFSWNEKWTPGQQLVHIRKSIAPVALAFLIPRFVLKYQFGVTNRASRTYEELVARYLKALEGRTAVAPKSFQPKPIPFATHKNELKSFQKSLRRLTSQVKKCSEKDLDYYVIPHPLIGKLTLREMIYFCIYHVQHHHKITHDIIKNVN